MDTTINVKRESTFGALEYAMNEKDIPVKVPFYTCYTCDDGLYREGGFSQAGQHTLDHHPDQHINVRIDMRYPDKTVRS